MKQPSSASSALGAHEIATARWGARTFVKSVLVLVGALVFVAVELGTNLPATAGKLGMLVIFVVPGVLLYFPLSWAAVRWVDRRIEERLAQGRR
jgi:hypothetical protein